MAIHHTALSATDFKPLTSGRQEPRQRTLFVVGKLTKGNREHVCRVRNISENGVGIEHDTNITMGDSVTIELRGLAQSQAVVRWVEGRLAGLHFVQSVRFEHTSTARGFFMRSPRFVVDRRVTLKIGDALIEARVRDIALGGMKVAVGNLDVGSATTIGQCGVETLITGRICWTSPIASGVRFTCSLATQELIAIVQSSHDVLPG